MFWHCITRTRSESTKIMMIRRVLIQKSLQQKITYDETSPIHSSVLDSIGNTPLMKVLSLSEMTSCEIYAKCEFYNPGGSVKDRVALQIVQEAMERKKLNKGGLVTEGTAGSTGVSLAMVASVLRLNCHVVMPDDAATGEIAQVLAYGATVERVRPVSITHADHFVNVAKRRAEEKVTNNLEKAPVFRGPV